MDLRRRPVLPVYSALLVLVALGVSRAVVVPVPAPRGVWPAQLVQLEPAQPLQPLLRQLEAATPSPDGSTPPGDSGSPEASPVASPAASPAASPVSSPVASQVASSAVSPVASPVASPSVQNSPGFVPLDQNPPQQLATPLPDGSTSQVASPGPSQPTDGSGAVFPPEGDSSAPESAGPEAGPSVSPLPVSDESGGSPASEGDSAGASPSLGEVGESGGPSASPGGVPSGSPDVSEPEAPLTPAPPVTNETVPLTSPPPVLGTLPPPPVPPEEDIESRGPVTPDEPESPSNGTAQTFYPGDVVDVSANSTGSSSSATANTAAVTNATAVPASPTGERVAGDGAVGENGEPPVLLGRALGQRDFRCGDSTLGRRQCAELDSLLTGAIREGSIGFNANEEEFTEEELEKLLEEDEWEVLASALRFSYCALRSQHNRRSVVKRMSYNLQVVVNPVPDENGTLTWMPVGLEAGVETPETIAAKTDALPIFSVCVQPADSRGFESSRADLKFNTLDGYVSGTDMSFIPLTNQSTKAEEEVNSLLTIACDRMRTSTNRTVCAVNPQGRMEATQEVIGTTAAIPERGDIVFLGYERTLLAESSIALVIAGLFLKDAAEAAEGDRDTKVRKFLRFHILIALFIAIVSQSFFSLWDLFSRVRRVRTGWIGVSIDRAWVLKSGLYALDISGSAVTVHSRVPLRNRLIVLPVFIYSFYLVTVFFLLASPLFRIIFPRGGRKGDIGGEEGTREG